MSQDGPESTGAGAEVPESPKTSTARRAISDWLTRAESPTARAAGACGGVGGTCCAPPRGGGGTSRAACGAGVGEVDERGACEHAARRAVTAVRESFFTRQTCRNIRSASRERTRGHPVVRRRPRFVDERGGKMKVARLPARHAVHPGSPDPATESQCSCRELDLWR